MKKVTAPVGPLTLQACSNLSPECGLEMCPTAVGRQNGGMVVVVMVVFVVLCREVWLQTRVKMGSEAE